MLGSIVVPTDFSSDAMTAAQTAAAIARSRNGAIHLLHVDTLPGGASETTPPMGVPPAIWTDYVAQRAAGGASLLAATARALDGELTVHSSVVFDETSTAILNQAELHHASLIVIGSHGTHGNRLLLGSVAAAVAMRATTPVLITRTAHGDRAPADGRFHCPLIAIHHAFSPLSATVLGELLDPAATVDLLPAWPSAMDDPATEVRDKLEQVSSVPPLERLETNPVVPERHLTNALLSRLEGGSHDLVVLGPQTAEVRARAGLGFLADRLIHSSPAPVLLLPPSTST